ncbi:MAG: NFACT family protein, partial [Oscillospiraceae bacterium]
MALDGMMLSLLRVELSNALVGARVEKIYQPTREELILSLRGFGVGGKMLLSAKASAPRVHLTALAVENPKQPPMFCMLLRKTIGAAKLIAIRQPGFERMLSFDFDTVNEFGDPAVVTLIAEIMGRHSNLILVGADGKIIDSVKRIGLDKSSVRQILPGLGYVPPPAQERIAVTDGAEAVLAALDA